MRHLRWPMALAAALLSSACAYGSAVDIAPMARRLALPPLAEGAYCETKGAGGAYMIISHKECVRLVWSRARRAIRLVETPPAKTQPPWMAVVDLGGGVYAIQTDVKDAVAPHELNVALVSGQAFALVATLDDDALKGMAARHPELVFSQTAKRPVILRGEPQAIEAFLLDAAKAAMRLELAKGEEMTVAVHDKAGAADHVASPAQARDIEAVKALGAGLAAP